MKVYEVGYSVAGSYEYVKQLMADENVLLIDPRYKRYSARYEWQEDELCKVYGDRYRPAGQYLGNLNYKQKGGPIKIANMAEGLRGLKMYLNEGRDLILLCVCDSYNACHRKVIIDALLEQMPDVEVVRQHSKSSALVQTALI